MEFRLVHAQIIWNVVKFLSGIKLLFTLIYVHFGYIWFTKSLLRKLEIIVQITEIPQFVNYYYLHDARRKLVILVPSAQNHQGPKSRNQISKNRPAEG